MRALLLAASVAFPAAGCAVSQPSVPIDAYLRGDFAHLRDFAAREVASGAEENLALALNLRGQAELLRGDYEAARGSLLRAGQVMGTWATGGGEAAAAVLGSEGSKTYKGDPYEKAMNAVYLAFCCLMTGEPDNARAALKRGILMDAEVADEDYQADNALLFWMAGRMSRLFGAGDEEDFFAEARTARSFAVEHGARGDAAPALLDTPAAGNLVVLLPVGLGPEKYAAGTERELARFRARAHPAVSAVATLDGAPLGAATILSDVVYQAQTLGGTVMEGIRKGKAVFRRSARISGAVLLDDALRVRSRDRDEAQAKAIVGGALLLLSALTAAGADTRHWPTLPSTVQVLVADAPPGPHELVVDFLDERGAPIPALRHVRAFDVPAAGEAWLLVPSLPAAGPYAAPEAPSS
jgi:hypothetical protein